MPYYLQAYADCFFFLEYCSVTALLEKDPAMMQQNVGCKIQPIH